MDSVKVYAMYLLFIYIHIFIFSKHNKVFFSCRVVNNKTIVFGRHWFGGSSSGKLDPRMYAHVTHIQLKAYNGYFSWEKRQILYGVILNRINIYFIHTKRKHILRKREITIAQKFSFRHNLLLWYHDKIQYFTYYILYIYIT